jgi:hypothetical protein
VRNLFFYIFIFHPLSSSGLYLYLKVKVTLRLTVSRSVRLGVRNPSGTRDRFFFLLEIFFRQLRVCYFVAPSLTIGWVCNLLLLLDLAGAVPLGSALSDERSGLSFGSMYIRYLHKIFALSVFDTVPLFQSLLSLL